MSRLIQPTLPLEDNESEEPVLQDDHREVVLCMAALLVQALLVREPREETEDEA